MNRCDICNDPAHIRQAYHPEYDTESPWVLFLQVGLAFVVFCGIFITLGVLA